MKVSGQSATAPTSVRTGLRDLATERHLWLGTAANVRLLRSDADNGRYRAAIAAEFNMVEPENELKPPSLWIGPDQYDWTNPDWLLGAPGQTGWAQANQLAVRGHVLVYARNDGYTLPEWIRQADATITPNEAKRYLHDYIHAVVGRYKGKILAWDVINEAIDDQRNDNPYNLRNGFWYRKLGIDFLKLALEYAHEADPAAELYVNEYGVEGVGWKSDSLFGLLHMLRDEGVVVTGAGLQYHQSVEEHIAPGGAHYQNFRRWERGGFATAITELDVAVPVSDPVTGHHATDPADLQRQADVYVAVLQLALTAPTCRCLQIWGCTDRHSWMPGFSRGTRGAATILDQDYQRKPAYHALEAALRGDPSPDPGSPAQTTHEGRS
jgi:endo-1,4-beta-xylanase